MLRITVVGAGGIGAFLGARLAAAGNEVTFLARGENLNALRARGVRLQDPATDVVLGSVRATDDPSAVGPADVVVIGVKCWQVAEIAATVKSLAGDRTLVLTVQNGVEAPGLLAEVLGTGRVTAGICAIASYLAGPGHVYHFGGRPWMTIGPIAPEPDPSAAEATQRLADALCAAGIECTRSPDMVRLLWRKFLLITSYGGICAVAGMPAGVVRSLPQTRRLVEEAMNEVVLVGRGHGVPLDQQDVQAMLRQLDELPPDTTSSMQRDIRAGRRSELHHLNGAVVRLGEDVAVVPRVHQFIYWSLLPAELRAAGELDTEPR